MKKITSIILTSIIFMTCSCESTTLNPVEINLDSTFSARTSNFAHAFTKTLEQEEKNNNFFVSPLGLHMALGMLLNGSDNASKDELIKTLKLDGLDLKTINASYLELIDKLPEIDKLVTNKLANSIWQRNGLDVSQDYKSTLKSYFKAEVFEEDFSPKTVTKINKWASDNTNAKIKEILKEISADQVLFLINALYFKGDWALKFDKKKSHDATFNGSKGPKTIEMMSTRDTFAFAEMSNFKAIDLNYGIGKYAMRVLLPNGNNPSELINSMNDTKWKEINEAMNVQKIDLKFPKFQMEYEKKLNETLSLMGMPSLFSSSADLSKISGPAGKLVVGFVKQNTFVAIDEEGTEAAAVTTIGIELTSVPNYPTFTVDKPFLFYIYEKSSGTIQFVGKILDLQK